VNWTNVTENQFDVENLCYGTSQFKRYTATVLSAILTHHFAICSYNNHMVAL